MKEHECNCRNKTTCPLQGNCLQTNIVYKDKESINNTTMYYIGFTEGTFKQRKYTHDISFSNGKYCNITTLSIYI